MLSRAKVKWVKIKIARRKDESTKVRHEDEEGAKRIEKLITNHFVSAA